MESTGNDRRDFARAIYQMHVRQWRTVELHRLIVFASFFLAVIASLVWLQDRIFLLGSWPVALFLLALSKIGYLLAFNQAIEIDSHRQAARYILERYSLDHYWPTVSSLFLFRLVSVDRLFMIFYLFAFCFFALALLYMLTGMTALSVAAAATVYAIGFLFTMLYKPKPAVKAK